LAIIEERGVDIVELVLSEHLSGKVDLHVVLIAFEDALYFF
jgi:hypothetical protein